MFGETIIFHCKDLESSNPKTTIFKVVCFRCKGKSYPPTLQLLQGLLGNLATNQPGPNPICRWELPPAAAAAEPWRALGAGGNCSQWPAEKYGGRNKNIGWWFQPFSTHLKKICWSNWIISPVGPSRCTSRYEHMGILSQRILVSQNKKSVKNGTFNTKCQALMEVGGGIRSGKGNHWNNSFSKKGFSSPTLRGKSQPCSSTLSNIQITYLTKREKEHHRLKSAGW